jgi:hypothetical protein
MHGAAFAPGFRLSLFDTAILAVGATATVALAAIVWWWGFVIGFVVGHFFLFCNVVRLARPLELAWAGIFLILASATIISGAPGWAITAAVSLAATLAVVITEIRKPSYHGLGWQWLNPRLPEWWETHGAKRNDACPTGD